MDKFYQPYSIQSSRRWSRNNFSDEDDTIFRMSDTDSGHFRSHRRSSSSSSSSQKMSMDTDDKAKSNNGRWKPSPFMPIGDHAGTTARRPSMIRCNSDTQISFNSVSNSRHNSEDAMSETSSNDGSSTVITPARRRKSFSGSHSPTSSMFAQDRNFGGGPERRSVTRRGSLLVRKAPYGTDQALGSMQSPISLILNPLPPPFYYYHFSFSLKDGNLLES